MRKVVLGCILIFALGDSCNNGVVGVQDYGSVTGRVLDATTNRPIADAIVSVGSLFTATADAQGAFTMYHIPIGDQTVTARMPGFTTASADVEIDKGQSAQAGYLRLVPVSKPDGEPTLPPPPTPTPPPPPETPIPAITPASEASPGPSTAPAAAPSPAPSASP